MITLHQFPISHYCEKVRWALDFKGLEHRLHHWVPGFHIKAMRKLAPRSSVPVLCDGDAVIQGSREILDHLESRQPAPALMPTEAALQTQVQDWERLADDEIGPAVRVLCYHHLLNDRAAIIHLFTQASPWHAKWLLNFGFKRLASRMRQFMRINAAAAQAALTSLHKNVDKITRHLGTGTHLVGDAFSRADLTVAALLAPLSQPPDYGVQWPATRPEALESAHAELRGGLDWVDAIYRAHRT